MRKWDRAKRDIVRQELITTRTAPKEEIFRSFDKIQVMGWD